MSKMLLRNLFILIVATSVPASAFAYYRCTATDSQSKTYVSGWDVIDWFAKDTALEKYSKGSENPSCCRISSCEELR